MDTRITVTTPDTIKRCPVCDAPRFQSEPIICPECWQTVLTAIEEDDGTKDYWARAEADYNASLDQDVSGGF
jgi:uncharacterized Zn finger protein (UPF0148 family)